MAITGSDPAQLPARLAILRLGTGRLAATLPDFVAPGVVCAIDDGTLAAEDLTWAELTYAAARACEPLPAVLAVLEPAVSVPGGSCPAPFFDPDSDEGWT